MPKLVITGGYDKPQLFQVPNGETMIGRELDCGLVLPHSSVSRHHAALVWDGRSLVVRDNESRNGIEVNGSARAETPLQCGDIIEIGGFHIHVLGDSEKFFEGRFVEYLPAYSAKTSASRGKTMMMAHEHPTDVDGMQQIIMQQARITHASDNTRFWCPENHRLTFGSAAMVEVSGMFTGGEVADITWQNGLHVLTKHKALTKVKHNGQSTNRAELHHGDTVQVGKTTFVYTSVQGH